MSSQRLLFRGRLEADTMGYMGQLHSPRKRKTAPRFSITRKERR